jgi:arginyl-tRNA synthetase|tara:strand:- start:4781 stop:6415 length:1635 start_codon:yes stop_codon:yes gene_type:complete
MNRLKLLLRENISLILSNLLYPEKEFSLMPPKKLTFGDLSSNLPLVIAKELKKKPMDIGEEILEAFNSKLPNYISKVTVTQPGFLNFEIKKSYFQNQIKTIMEQSKSFGRGHSGLDKRANVEFVSANPTGPLTIGHGRNAVLGDTVSNILEWQGYDVTREYYFNDAGRQMRILGESVEARYNEILGKKFSFPEDGYQGDYIKEIAQIVLNESKNKPNLEKEIFKKTAEKEIFKDIKKSLNKLGIHFNIFTNEKTFYENGDIERLLEELRSKNLIYEKDNATWFKTSALGKEQDRVFIKSTGEPTYRVPDTAYHKNKVEREFDLIIDVFGADHADTYPDVLLALEALNQRTDHIKVLLYQFVTLLKEGEKVKMSTRKANYITLDYLVKEVGLDVVRYFFIMRSMNTHLDFDLDLAKDQSEKNPVFYLQYAYARICNIIKRGESSETTFNEKFNPAVLSDPEELYLLKYLIRFPDFMNLAYENLEPQNIANYLQELSSRFHKFYSHCRVLSEDSEISKARMALVKSVKIVLENGLNVLGISCPERM